MRARTAQSVTAQPEPADRPRKATVPGAARWLLAAVTLLAVLSMHSLMGPGGAAGHPGGTAAHGAAHPAAGAPTYAEVSSPARHVLGADLSLPDGDGCGGGPCRDHGDHGPPSGGHTLAHLCLAVLAGAVAALEVWALSPGGGLSAVLRERLVPVGRGSWPVPPWTHLSLAQLSVLRV